MAQYEPPISFKLHQLFYVAHRLCSVTLQLTNSQRRLENTKKRTYTYVKLCQFGKKTEIKTHSNFVHGMCS